MNISFPINRLSAHALDDFSEGALLELLEPFDFSMIPNTYFIKVAVHSDIDMDISSLNKIVMDSIKSRHPEKKEAAGFYSLCLVEKINPMPHVVLSVGSFEEV